MTCVVCVDESGNLTANNLSGINTGDQTITLTGDVTGSGTGTFAATIANDAVTFAKMQNVAADKLIGRDTAGTGDPEEIGVGGGIEFTGSGAIQRSALTGDVTASAGSNSTTISGDAVTFAKMQNIATDKLIGRDTAGTGDPEEIGVGGGIEFTGSGALQRSTLTGDVTASAGSNSTTIANDAVTYAKMQDVSTASKLLGRGSASGSGNVEEISLGTGLSMSGTSLSISSGSQPGLVLLQTITASNQATVDLETTFDSIYETYFITFSNVHPTTDDVFFYSRWKVGGSYQSSDYAWVYNSVRNLTGNSPSTGASVDEPNQNQIRFGFRFSNNATRPFSGQIYIHSPANTAAYKISNWSLGYIDNINVFGHDDGSATYQGSSGAVTGVRFFFSDGNIGSGEFKLYGLKKSI